MLTDFQPHNFFMQAALREAERAFAADEVPVGAVVVFQHRIIAKAHNQTEQLTDATAHAEMLAITAAQNFVGAKYLKQCRLYVTLEPCPMCAGAAKWAQVGEIIFGAFDEQRGFRRHIPSLLHPKTQLTGGILELECADLMQRFFQSKRG